MIAIPLTLIVKKVFEIFEGTRWLAALMSIGSESESSESRQAVERLKGLGGSLRDLIPFGNGARKRRSTTSSRLPARVRFRIPEVAVHGAGAHEAAYGAQASRNVTNE